MNPIGNVSNSFYGNTSLSSDGTRRSSGDTAGAGQTTDTRLASGIETREDSTLAESTASAQTGSALVQVVEEAQEASAQQSNGSIIDVFA